MDTVSRRHVLRWTQPRASCNSTVLYSVQYQGEFELLIRNGSWINATECQRIPLTSCDLTFDLGSDSDYSLRVRAQCGSKMSAWTRFLFNRNNITPPVPELRLTAAGAVLLVSVRKFPLTAVTTVTMWRKDKGHQTKVYSMPADQEVLQVAALQEGAVYCVKAKVVLNQDVQSGFTDSHCFHHRSWRSGVEAAHRGDGDGGGHVGPPDRFVLVARPLSTRLLSTRLLSEVFPERAAAAVAERKRRRPDCDSSGGAL
ncbi:interleukin-20 receptor subunit beta-like isoform X2 [Poeciliopsis prolifica]|uniref:interleukin-20 receptor subunit beta-like isoform X2 n=1 Tax=Poeciliopsis prolifica TaxID=188132 RepID=UPI002413E407|nr:interleukin-20 receptor subunit beta-like isoform X2 [Poeciliopsis prolifica]